MKLRIRKRYLMYEKLQTEISKHFDKSVVLNLINLLVIYSKT